MSLLCWFRILCALKVIVDIELMCDIEVSVTYDSVKECSSNALAADDVIDYRSVIGLIYEVFDSS